MLESSYAADLVLQQIVSSAAVLDAEGVILDVSEGWKAFADQGGLRLPDYGLGTNYLKYCVFPEKSSVELLNGLQQVLRDQIDCFGTVYECDSPQQKRWFVMTAFPVAGSLARAAVVHYNVSSFVRRTADPSVIMLGRGPGAAEHAQEALAKLVKRSVSEALSSLKIPSAPGRSDARSVDQRKISRLNDREVRLLNLLATGATNSEIAKALAISVDAAKFRVVGLTRKLGLKNRTQAAVFAARNGLVD
jgi:DNA-binding NarL/FixJ family response regulator